MSLPSPLMPHPKKMTHSPHNQLIDKSDLVIHCYETILFYPFWSWKFLSINPLVILVPRLNAPLSPHQAGAVKRFETTKTTYPVLIPKSLFFFYTKEDIMESERSPLFLERKKCKCNIFSESFKKEMQLHTQEKNKTHKKKDWHKNKPKKAF